MAVDQTGDAVKYRVLLSCGLFLNSIVSGQEFKPPGGFVPNKETAVKIAEAVLIPVYGKKMIESEEPFTAKLQTNVWTVEGTLHCENGAEHCDGGTAMVQISKVDGRILSMHHGK